MARLCACLYENDLRETLRNGLIEGAILERTKERKCLTLVDCLSW